MQEANSDDISTLNSRIKSYSLKRSVLFNDAGIWKEYTSLIVDKRGMNL